MKIPFTAKVIAALISFLILSGCDLPTPTPTPYVPGGVDVGVSEPEANSTWYVGQEIELYGWASTPGGETVDSFTFYADGQQITTRPAATSGAPADMHYALGRWRPTAAGEHHIRVKALSKNSTLGTSDSVRICVLDVVFPDMMYGSFSTQEKPVVGYSGPCEIPATTVSFPPQPVSLSATAAPASLAIRTDACPSAGPATISFQASVTDPGNRVAFVIVDIFVSYSDPNSTGAARERLGLVQTSTSGITRVFTGSSSDLSEQMQDAGTIYTPTMFHWIAYALDLAGFIIAKDGPHDIPAGECNPPPVPLVPFPVEAAPPTPASARDCPPGTYYAPVTHRCIAIQIAPTKQGSNCSKYTDYLSCEAHGCTWHDYGVCE